MRILITPMSCPIETAGPTQRSVALAKACLQAGYEVAFCAAENANYHTIERIRNCRSPLPEPLGLPYPLGTIAMNIAIHAGFIGKQKIHSFEQVLHLMGILKPAYFFHDCAVIEQAISEYNPDIVYSEFRLPAIIAARRKKIPLTGGYSYPAQASFRSDPKYSKKLRQELASQGMQEMESILDIFSLQNKSFVASSPELEPMKGENIIHVGPFFNMPAPVTGSKRNIIVVYLGNSSMSQKNAAVILKKAFAGTEYQIYFAAQKLKPEEDGNIHIAKHYNFAELLPQAACFIHHGGQNSSVSGLLAGTPQLIFPGTVFERQYNADSVADNGAGIRLKDTEFLAENLKSMLKKIESTPSYREKSIMLGNSLRQLGGTSKIIKEMEALAGQC